MPWGTVTWYWLAAGVLAVLAAGVVLARRQTWRDSMTLSIVGWLALALVVAFGTGGTLLWLLGWPSLPRSSSFTTAETLDLLKIALAVVAGFGGVVILSVNHRKQRFAEKAHTLAEEQDVREQSKLQNERFAAAAEQLGHERPQVRLAGVYALAGLADDWTEGRQKCVEVLISYLRLTQVEDRTDDPGEEEIVGTIFRIFRQRLVDEGSSWGRLDYDFTGMRFEDADFGDLWFHGRVTFDGATFTGGAASFTDTRFAGGLSCHATEFAAEVTDFRRVSFGGRTEVIDTSFTTPVDFRRADIGGTVEFYRCAFADHANFTDLTVMPGSIRLANCEFAGPAVSFDRLELGLGYEPWWVSSRLGEPRRISALSVVGCEFDGCDLTMDPVLLQHSQLAVRDLVLNGGSIRIKPIYYDYPLLYVRRIDARHSIVDLPVEEDEWRMPPSPAAPSTAGSEGDRHGRVGQDGADVGQEL